jgi:phage baseplate assembly protein W
VSELNLPEFGCGLLKIVIEGNTEGLASQVKFTITQALSRWLGGFINVEEVATESRDGELRIEVTYTRKDTLVQDSVFVNI